MACQLILMRHAKSGHDDPSLSDHDRPLNPRGERDSPRIARWLEEQGLIPDRILCSSSVRTRQTAELMQRQWSVEPELVICESLYLSSPQSIVETLQRDHSGCERVRVLAHNPGMSMLASMLAGKLKELKTAAVAVFDIELDGPSPANTVSALSPFETLCVDTTSRLTHFASPRTIEV